ncbi:beta-ketoacyl-ACP synthase, partial [Pseudomonas syringae pv. tagetis]
MGRVSRQADAAAQHAQIDPRMLKEPINRDGLIGTESGSTTGSTQEIKAFGNMLNNTVAVGLNANSYLRMMPPTTSSNISIIN